ncbi:MAG: ice-binding family protein [bacterium]|nr:ice-binding family protein [bacterium]
MNLSRRLASLTALVGILIVTVAPVANAATSPDLGAARSFVILSDTYTNTVSGTTLTGDLGYTTPPAVAPTVNGTTHAANSTYNQAGIDQNAALANLNSQPCTFNFAPGAIDLASDTTHGPVGVYTPGVYCVTGGDSVGGGGTITLSGSGTYIFRIDGALTTSANSVVQTANGATICDVWWTPTQATTLGADSTFLGNVISASGNTVGNNVNWTGRALSFGGTVSTAADTISSAVCSANTSVPTPGLPDTGLSDSSQSSSLWLLIPASFLATLTGVYFIRKRV